jgi:hypothetical protein
MKPKVRMKTLHGVRGEGGKKRRRNLTGVSPPNFGFDSSMPSLLLLLIFCSLTKSFRACELIPSYILFKQNPV